MAQRACADDAHESSVHDDLLAILGMGGTIDKDYPRATKGYAFEIEEPAAGRILSALPFTGLQWTVTSVCKKDSTEIVQADRELLVKQIQACRCTRVVVTHGTDSLIETAKHVALSGVGTGARLH